MVSLKGHRVYLDANTVICAVELPHFSNLKAGLLKPLDERKFTAVTSEITLVETIVGPRKAGNAATEQLFRTFLTPSSNFILEPITLAVLEKVIDLRSQFPGFKTLDAIHLAPASTFTNWCKVLLTVTDVTPNTEDISTPNILQTDTWVWQRVPGRAHSLR